MGEWNGQFCECRRRQRDVQGSPRRDSKDNAILEMTAAREDLPPALSPFPTLSFLLPSSLPGVELPTEPPQSQTGH